MLGASASRKAGIPIVTVEAIVNWRGSSGNVAVGIATARSITAVNTVLVTNSRATRWMLRRIWRPSLTIPGTAAKSSRTSTRSATERAICVPDPCAIASRASLRAGTSLTPSPTIAT